MSELRVLLVEDNEDDARLLLNELKFVGGYTIVESTRVQTAAALEHALLSSTWDVILSDYNLPGFNGLEALKVAQRHSVDLPFILVSGMIGEETAVAALKAGAHDYLLKDRLFKLPQVIHREMFEAEQRRLLREAQAELAVAKEFAELANQRKSQVLAFVAHEFKNPLQAIQLFADMLKRPEMGLLSEVHQTSANNIGTAVNQLKGLVDDILDIAAIEAGKIHLNLQPVVMTEVIEAALVIVREQAKQRSITIQSNLEDSLPAITADPNRVRQMLINLLSNAIKYSPEGSCVTLLLQVEPSQEAIRISVSDQGVGISEADLRQLFQEFYRVFDQFNSQTEGIGLGLALTKHLVELHQGYIDVSSEPGLGSTFSITLPIQLPVSDASLAMSAAQEKAP